MNATVVDRLLPLVLAYAEGRLEQKALRRAYVALRCQAALGPCYAPGMLEPWCESCQRRDPLFAAYRLRKRENRRLLAHIERVAPRLTLPDVPPQPAEPKLLLELMGDEGAHGTT